tara:strand:- start:824 stop:1342 length:519 start_codon:yes stop_codon:yes gene_type:complete
MKKIAIISDTHGFLDKKILIILKSCDEIWHAGDFGYNTNIKELLHKYTVNGVYGNIDGSQIRSLYPKIAKFQCENIKILMTHIGGYPNKYQNAIEEEIKKYKPNLYICGHSHILKVMYDSKYNLLHINPGAAGKEGFHKMRTMILIKINGKRIYDLEVVELGARSKLSKSIN